MISSRPLFTYGLLAILAAGLALLSLTYVRPRDCQQICDEPLQAVCPAGACRFGEQRAGFPLPIVIDDPGGGSPTSGWGRLGIEDFPNPFFFLMDVGFYAALLWVIQYTLQWMREGKQAALTDVRQVIQIILLPLGLPLGMILIFLYLGFHFYGVSAAAQDLSQPQTAILGNWRLTDAAGEEFIFRFYGDGRISVSLSGAAERDNGLYLWVGDDAIQISFAQNYPLSDANTALCTRLPTFLKDQCRASKFEPAGVSPEGYPFPVEPTQVSAYPAPTLIPIGVSQIEVIFDVSVNGNALILRESNGTAQDFQRVVR